MSQANPKRSLSRSTSVRRKQPNRFAKKSNFKRRSKKPKTMNGRGPKSPKYFGECPAKYELQRKMELAQHVQVRPVHSNQSVIFIKSFPPKENIPVIDLTKSNHHLKYTTALPSANLGSNTSLKVIYKSKNFGRIPKPLTTSLVAIPINRKSEKPRKFCSTSKLIRCSKEKITCLDLPNQYFDEDTDCSDYSCYDSSMAELNDDDKKMMDYILINEDIRSSTGSLKKYVKLDAKQPLENMCELYGITSSDNFD